MRATSHTVALRRDELGWILVTREQLSLWLEAEGDEEGTALTDLMLR